METTHEDTVRISHVGVMHGIRTRQELYQARFKKNVTVAETFCGRHRPVGDKHYPSKVTCRSCQRAMKSEN